MSLGAGEVVTINKNAHRFWPRKCSDRWPGIMILSVEPGRWGHLYLVIMFQSIEPGRWGLFVSSNNDCKCRNMVGGCHLSMAKGRRGSFDIRL